MKHVPITRRYWFWQHQKMLADDVGYLVSGGLRPRAIKWLPTNESPGAITMIPDGWMLDPAEIGHQQPRAGIWWRSLTSSSAS